MWRIKKVIFWQLYNHLWCCSQVASIDRKPTKETGCDTSTPSGCHVMKTGWFSPITELACNQGRLKNSRDRWYISFIGCTTDRTIKAETRIINENNKQKSKFKFKNWFAIMKFLNRLTVTVAIWIVSQNSQFWIRINNV